MLYIYFYNHQYVQVLFYVGLIIMVIIISSSSIIVEAHQAKAFTQPRQVKKELDHLLRHAL